MNFINTDRLRIAYSEQGPSGGTPVILLHGFPYGPQDFNALAPLLAQAGYRVLCPALRGFGETRFLQADTPRSGQQGALAADLLAFMQALDLPPAVLLGYDWGGRAACMLAALWPQRVRALITCGQGYNIQNIRAAAQPQAPEIEQLYWYQYYFHTDRGRKALEQQPLDLAEHIWALWSPTWPKDAQRRALYAPAFDNPDFAAVVQHSYMHRFGNAAGDPAYDSIEDSLALQPTIGVPTYVVQGDSDSVDPLAHFNPEQLGKFSDLRSHIVLPGIGHNPPAEAPQRMAALVLQLDADL